MPDSTEVFQCDHCRQDFNSELAADECCDFYCGHCGDRHESDDEAYACCHHECHRCGNEFHSEDEADECCQHECRGCGATYEYEYQADECCQNMPGHSNAVAVAEARQAHADYFVQIASLPGRTTRLISVEQEISEGAGSVCHLLGQGGLLGYTEGGRPGGVLIKEDGSLGYEGGEVLYSRFNLSDSSDSTEFSRMTAQIASLRSSRAVSLRPNAGVHIHVSCRDMDGEMFTPRAMAALYEMFEWASPLLYPLSSLGWGSHRGEGYCRKPDKIADLSPGKVAQRLTASGERYLGLNYQRLLDAVNRCRCGACSCGDWNACTCGVLNDATIEWRLFNSTTSPKTLHTYLIVALSMTAHAMRYELGSLSANPNLDEIAGWMVNELPLTYSERSLLREQIGHAPGLAGVTV